MTRIDVKNYLEKIYNVPVLNVKTVNQLGKTRQNAYGAYIVKDDDQKIAFVTLPPGECLALLMLKPVMTYCADYKFEWPELKIGESENKQKEDSEVRNRIL